MNKYFILTLAVLVLLFELFLLLLKLIQLFILIVLEYFKLLLQLNKGMSTLMCCLTSPSNF